MKLLASDWLADIFVKITFMSPPGSNSMFLFVVLILSYVHVTVTKGVVIIIIIFVTPLLLLHAFLPRVGLVTSLAHNSYP